MNRLYAAFGLCIRVNCALPGLNTAVAPRTAVPTVNIICHGASSDPGVIPVPAAAPSYVTPYRDAAGRPVFKVWQGGDDGRVLWQYSDGTHILFSCGGTRVEAWWSETATLEDTATYLLGPAIGYVARLHGYTCLHASAVLIEGRAVAFVGASGAGKSTLAGAFARAGYPVITDDILVIAADGAGIEVFPGYPRLRLWPRSVEMLYGRPDALPRITPTHPTWDKRFLDLAQPEPLFVAEPCPLAAIYMLRPHAPSPAPARLRGADGVVELLANTYLKWSVDAAMHEREFDALWRVATAVPIKQMSRTATVFDLRDRILADCQIDNHPSAARNP